MEGHAHANGHGHVQLELRQTGRPGSFWAKVNPNRRDDLSLLGSCCAQTAACARSRYSFQVSHSGTRRWRSCCGILACADHVSAFSVSLQNSPSANKHAEYIWIQIKMFISIIPFLPFAGALLHSLVLFLFFFFSSPTVLCSLQLWVCNSSSTNPLKTEHQIHLSNLLILHCITGFIIWAFVLFIPLAACAGVFWTQCRVHVLLLFDS